MSNNSAVIECNKLGKVYQDGELYAEVLKDFNLTVEPGAKLAVVGASGSGKSTLLHMIGGLDKPTSGKVLVFGQDINNLGANAQGQLRNKYLGFVYQFHHLLPEFTALENVAMPLLIRGDVVANAKNEAHQLLEQVGLATRVKHRLSELSGGERQRVAIARSLVTRPACLIADEPTGNLDHKTAETIYDLLEQIHQETKISLIIATHDLSLASRMGDTLRME